MDRVIAIDGPSGVGKSSVSRQLANRLDWTYLDTGAMYRTVTLAWQKAGADPSLLEQQAWLEHIDLDIDGESVLLNGEDVSKAIREAEVTANASRVAAIGPVRTHLTSMQREIASKRACILDGRDIGTVVFPNAFFKVFLTASSEERARRRWLQQGGESSPQTMAEVLADQNKRDHQDANRAIAPLKKAEDALEFNTDPYTLDEVIDALETEARNRLS